MTLTETITNELVDASEDPGKIQELFRKYGNTKGPFYKALATATNELLVGLNDLNEEIQSTRSNLEDSSAQKQRMQDEQANASRTFEELKKKLERTREELSQLQPSVAAVGDLERLGFGKQELHRLHEILIHISATSGISAAEAVEQFFQATAQYEQVTSLTIEIGRARTQLEKAKADADRWESEARSREARTKARASAIDAFEKVVAMGVRERDLVAWSRIVSDAGVSVESLASELERYKSIQKLLNDRQASMGKLSRELANAEERLKVLQGEYAQTRTAITTVKDGCIAEIEQSGMRAREVIDGLNTTADRYQELHTAMLGHEAEFELGKAFSRNNTSLWESLSRESIQLLCLGFLKWIKHNAPDLELRPPEIIRRRSSGLSSYTKVNAQDLVSWAVTAAFPERELSILTGDNPSPPQN